MNRPPGFRHGAFPEASPWVTFRMHKPDHGGVKAFPFKGDAFESP